MGWSQVDELEAMAGADGWACVPRVQQSADCAHTPACSPTVSETRQVTLSVSVVTAV